MRDDKDFNARYAVDIRGHAMHVEAENLTEIGSLLNGQMGRAHVIDRQTQRLLFEGTVEEVRKAIGHHLARWGGDAPLNESAPITVLYEDYPLTDVVYRLNSE